MLIPLGTERPSGKPALVTPFLMGLTIVSFVAMAVLTAMAPERATELERTFWVVGGEGFRWWQPLTSTLLHGGLLHLAGNMLFLWVFGPSVEGRFGRLGFIALYLGSAYFSGSLHALVSPAPAIGASGAIAGVTGSFLVLFPKTTVRCFTLLGFGIIGVPAWWFVGFAIVWDIFSQGLGARTGVAHAAHLGGYSAGFGVSMLLLWLKVFPREPYDLFTIFRQAHRRRQFREAGVIRERDTSRVVSERSKSPDKPTHKPEPKPDPKRAAIAAARMQVSKAAASGDLPAAATAYADMLTEFGTEAKGTTLTRRLQYDVANQLHRAGDHKHAAHAYEALLELAPDDIEAPTVRLMLGVLYARYLGQPQEARPLLEQTMPKLEGDQQELAQEILTEIA